MTILQELEDYSCFITNTNEEDEFFRSKGYQLGTIEIELGDINSFTKILTESVSESIGPYELELGNLEAFQTDRLFSLNEHIISYMVSLYFIQPYILMCNEDSIQDYLRTLSLDTLSCYGELLSEIGLLRDELSLNNIISIYYDYISNMVEIYINKILKKSDNTVLSVTNLLDISSALSGYNRDHIGLLLDLESERTLVYLQNVSYKRNRKSIDGELWVRLRSIDHVSKKQGSYS